MPSKSNSYFKRFGHLCDLDDDERIDKIFTWTSIDPTSKTTLLHFKSYSSIINNRKFHIENHRHTIHPFSFFKTLWEMLMMVVLLVCLILEPLRFLQMVESTHWHTEWSYINIINVIDIVLRLSVMGYWDKRNFEVSKHELVF